MKATEIVKELQELIDKHGDGDIDFWDSESKFFKDKNYSRFSYFDGKITANHTCDIRKH